MEHFIEEIHRHKMDALVRKICRKHKVKGASVMLVDRTKVLYENYYGVVDEAGTPNAAERRMMIGSNQKMLTGLAIMTLVDQGKLSLKDDVRTILPEFSIRSRDGDQPIRVGDVLMHRAGLPGDDFSLILKHGEPLTAVLDALKDTYTTVKPGVMFAYSNLGYGLLGLIIEKVSGMDYADYMKKRVLKPLGMDDVDFLDDDEARKAASATISQAFDKKGKQVNDDLGSVVPAGSSTYATARSLAKLAWLFLNPEKPALLKKESLAQMLKAPESPHMLDGEQRIGLGIMHHEKRYYNHKVGPLLGHGGATICHISVFHFFPRQGLGIIVLTNSRGGMHAAGHIADRVALEALKAKGLEMPKMRKNTQKLATKTNTDFVKDYVMPGMKLLLYKDKKGRMVAKMPPFKATFKACKDGYIKGFPRGLTRIPPLAGHVKRLRIKHVDREGMDVLYLEQKRPYHEVTIPMMGALEHVTIPTAWRDALGDYVVSETHAHVKPYFKKVKLEEKKGHLVLSLVVLDSKMSVYLKALNDEEALIQGIGRSAQETVFLRRDGDKVSLKHQGVLLDQHKKAKA